MTVDRPGGGAQKAPSVLVDVVIPVHRVERPIERAVASVVGPSSGAPGVARALVVCHNIDPALFASRLAPFGEAVQVLRCTDGIPSPAGPLNTGLAAARAPWVTCMGSDDHYEDGSVVSWAAHLRLRDPDVLILPVLDERDGSVDIPPVRPCVRQDLDPVKDRLTYRTGPLMLVKTPLITAHAIRMTEGLRTGEDLAYSARVWSAATRIDLLDPSGPCYVEGDDGSERVTRIPFPLEELLAPVEKLAEQEWLTTLDRRFRHALAVRILRRNLLPAIQGHAFDLSRLDVEKAAACCKRWLEIDPDLPIPLSIAEERLFAAVCRSSDPLVIARCADEMTNGPRMAKVMPRTLRGLLEADTRVRHLFTHLTRPRKRAS